MKNIDKVTKCVDELAELVSFNQNQPQLNGATPFVRMKCGQTPNAA
jgi:hypothetical protein